MATPVEILLVEDNLGDIELTREALAEGHLANQLHVARDGEEALDFLFRRPPFTTAPRPDLVLLDLNLPRLSGREVLAAIKADEALAAIPVVVLTSSAEETDVVRSYELHANCYVQKPVGFEEFSRIVRDLENFWFMVVKLPTRK